MATKPRRDKQARIVDAALQLATERGWSEITLDDIAAAAKLDVDEVYRLTPTKSAVLNAFVRRTDLAVLEGQPEADEEEAEVSTHDRLFDILIYPPFRLESSLVRTLGSRSRKRLCEISIPARIVLEFLDSILICSGKRKFSDRKAHAFRY